MTTSHTIRYVTALLERAALQLKKTIFYDKI